MREAKTGEIARGRARDRRLTASAYSEATRRGQVE